MKEINKHNVNFEKMNATLANPEFANWYYNQIDDSDKEFNIDEFIKILNDYNENNMQ